jgi:hypothetical protein
VRILRGLRRGEPSSPAPGDGAGTDEAPTEAEGEATGIGAVDVEPAAGTAPRPEELAPDEAATLFPAPGPELPPAPELVAEAAAAPAPGPPRRTRRGWSLRAHLITVAVAALVMLILAAALLTTRDFRSARDDAATFGQHISKLGALELSDTIPEIRGLMIRSGAAVGFTTGGKLDTLPPDKCNLNFSPFREFRTGTLRLVLPDGAVQCSSGGATSAPGTRPYAGASWLKPVLDNSSATVVGPLVDPASRRWVLFVAAPVPFGGHAVGALVLGLDVQELAPALRQRLSGIHRFDVLVTDSKGQRIVSWSVRPSHWVGGHLLKSFARAEGRRGIRLADPDGTVRLFAGRGKVGGLGWHVYTGVPMSAVRAPAQSDLYTRLAAFGLVALGIALLALLGTVTVTRR